MMRDEILDILKIAERQGSTIVGDNGPSRSGRTTKAMKSLAIGGVYIWCNNRIGYPKMIAEKIGRTDIKVVPISWLTRGHGVSCERFTDIALDHACYLSDFNFSKWEYIKNRTRKAVK